MSDADEKVGDGAPARNNRIVGDDFLNRYCAFGGHLESMLLGDPPQNRFSTVSVTLGKSHIEHIEFASPAESGHADRAEMRQETTMQCSVLHAPYSNPFAFRTVLATGE